MQSFVRIIDMMVIRVNNNFVCVYVRSHFSRVWLLATPWTVAHQAPLSMGFPRQEYRSGLPFSFPGDLPHPGMEPGSPALQADSLPTELPVSQV